MSDRIPHDHPSIDTVRATIDRAGSMAHPKLVLPAEPSLFPAGIVHITLDGQQYRARIERSFDDTPEIRSVYDNARLVRDGAREQSVNRLREWFDEGDLDYGRSIHVDIIEPGHQYAVRRPGATAVYAVVPQPDQSLSDIADSLEDH
ncbi:DUF7112 family protein [Halocatena pleomorpha]|uniref:Uncharacterized protein n=1 Tax=Halocatena pleomorpha TaxID=1785090 RepID=A0A3P3R686_9EURY|nr:hypothetical protein [Halocatena pleomorpha]RRJ28419.1 hypothetical protein EIK79_15705 [Halocatena pleomorpha]